MSEGKKTTIFFVLDDSGSMSSYSRGVREAVKAITTVERNTAQHKFDYKFISFSCGAVFSDTLDALPLKSGSTNIEAAFRLLDQQVVLESKLPEELVVVFVSDGADNNHQTINGRLKRLSGTKSAVPTTLFTIAVGSGFPTSMVVSALRPKYHSASDCLPLVFPVSHPSELMTVFEQLSNYVFNKDHFNVTMEFNENASLSELEDGVDAIYNYYTVKCTHETDKKKCIALIHEGKKLLENMLRLATEKEKEQRETLGEALQDKARKPLASNILQVAHSQRKRVQTAINGSLQRLNLFLEETTKGNLLSNLSDVEKQKVLSYGNVVGKHLVKSLQYNSADFVATKAALKKALSEYDEEQARADEEVSDYIINQAEAMLDAQECTSELVMNAESLASIVDTLAVVGRLINIKTCSGTQINPYLVEVVSLPTILQHMNTIDFFRLHSGEYVDQHRTGEVANSILPVTTNKSEKNFLRGPLGSHICTYLLCKNQELCFRNAMVAMQAALVSFCLTKRDEFHAGVLEETFTSFAATHSPTNWSGLFKYIEHVGSDSFREALVTESDSLPKHIKCEHLSKFILALYVLIRQGKALTTAQLLERMRACMVEMVGRGDGGSIYSHVKEKKAYTPEEILAQVPTGEALKAFTAHEAAKLFEATAAGMFKTTELCSVTELETPADIPVTCMGFSRASLSAIFARLNSLAGNPPSDEFELPNTGERLSILAHGLAHSSFDRNITHPEVPECAPSSLRAGLERAYASVVLSQAEAFITPLFLQAFDQCHEQSVKLPPQYCAQYTAETGRDVALDFSVSEESWLSNVACSCPRCPNFMRRMAAPAQTAEGKPRICDALLRHLQTCPDWILPSFQRSAKGLAMEDPASRQDEEARVKKQVSALCTGALMRDADDAARQKAGAAVVRLGGAAALEAHLQKEKEEYRECVARMPYAKFKAMLDAAYELPVGKSAGVPDGEDFEMVSAKSAAA
mmetsp:Transcript_38049/g.78070  ORF Transcript_38049/g.78070 Transcript_38049/m.78070 type:complete len:976 (-) Transcript_38049:168-3095(-)|eukprot:CAMPEP_0181292648 /NCGR_PEP_ID=MMETSP1101-20121128/2624_1 /TAXON_ID=46948 /ORGANISM="Rhodomonas abbreviata, Strain Caron Lab Isolate" /LENGTH=975 /DNA_ID=CAMNT_0023397143 /DNA_START=184 /DNA_END=3111 /DNA_ORIENTATION=+